MSGFDIIEEKGYSRRLTASDLSPTPWLLSTRDGLRLGEMKFHQIILSDRGYIPLRSPLDPDFDQFNDLILDSLPEWSILTPRLLPTSENLKKSLEYELNLFLDRLDKSTLPKFFGFPYDPLNSPDGHLDELLSFQPSIIALRYPYLESLSPRVFVKDLMEIREKIPPNVALYLPGGVAIGFSTLALVLGVDILDDGAAYRFAANKRRFIDDMVHYDPDLPLEQMITRNLGAIRQDFEYLNYHLDRNTLWTRLAKNMHTHPAVASAVNLLGRDYADQLQLVRFLKSANNKLQFTGEEGLLHPDVLAFQRRIRQNYRLRDEVKIIVLLPCSAKKPYNESKSHRYYNRAIKAGSDPYNQFVEVWSLTSPLGVVPRELEMVYPAQNYDIPVTGHWSDEETSMTAQLLIDMLAEVPKDVQIIAHVSEGYRGVIEQVAQLYPIEISWIGERPRSKEPLAILSQKVRAAVERYEYPKVDGKKYYREVRDMVNAVTKYHHGLQAQLDFDSSKVRILGRPPRPYQIQKDKQHWITWDYIHGEVRLSERAVKEIALQSDNWILVGADKLRGSTLFGVGVVEASELISPGDEVVFFNEDKSLLLGIGVATVSGITMNRVDSGPVANIRKKMVFQSNKLNT